MKTIRIKYVDFWKGFNEAHIYVFKELLQKKFNLVQSESPDILIFGTSGNEHQKYKCIKVFYTGENIRVNNKQCDFSFSFDDMTETNFQLPNFARYKTYFDFINQNGLNKWQKFKKTKFCNFIHRNANAKERIIFCQQLMKYKQVDCPGNVLNNMPKIVGSRQSTLWMDEKIEFLKSYKFTIAFENESSVNYITEKIFHSFLVGSIPIYWGAKNIGEFFNPKRFINVNDFKNFNEVIEYIKEIDTNDELYNNILAESPINKKSKLKWCTEDKILQRFEKIICTTRRKNNE